MRTTFAPQTAATVLELRAADWFCKVGNRDLHAAKVVASWEEAVELCLGEVWENVRLDAANALTRRLALEFPSRYQEWGDIAPRVRTVVDDLLDTKVRPVVSSSTLPEAFLPQVGWDISHLLMESEYADVVKPAFFAVLGFYYLKGRFPCGWEGEFPEGRLIVY